MSGHTVKYCLIKHRSNNWYKPLSKRGTYARIKHVCSQSLRSPWPAVRKRKLWEQPFRNNKGNNQILWYRILWFHYSVCIYDACLKWLLSELPFSDRWSRGTTALGTRLVWYAAVQNEQNIAHQTREQKIECLMAFKCYQTRPNTIKQHQTRWPNGHVTMFDGVWSSTAPRGLFVQFSRFRSKKYYSATTELLRKELSGH